MITRTNLKELINDCDTSDIRYDCEYIRIDLSVFNVGHVVTCEDTNDYISEDTDDGMTCFLSPDDFLELIND